MDPRRAPARAHRGGFHDPHPEDPPARDSPTRNESLPATRTARGIPTLRHPEGIPRVPDRPAALAGSQPLSSEHVLQDRLVEAEVGHQPLQLGTLVIELLQPTNFRDARLAELLVTRVERLLRHAELAADLPNRLTSRLLRQDESDLLFRETLLLHSNHHAGWRPKCPRQLAASFAQESGGRPPKSRAIIHRTQNRVNKPPNTRLGSPSRLREPSRVIARGFAGRSR